MNKCAFCEYSVPTDNNLPIWKCECSDCCNKTKQCKIAIDKMMEYNVIRKGE